MYTLLVVLVVGPDVASLGSDTWGRRDSAEARLRALGCLAWPALLDAEHSPDPEVRHRAGRLLAPYRSLRADLRAWEVLADPWPLTGGRLAGFVIDHGLRCRVHRAAVACGLVDGWERCEPGHDGGGPLFVEFIEPEYVAWRVAVYRERLGTKSVGWPFK